MAAWTGDQVLALAPDASSQRAARTLATPAAWSQRGHAPEPASLWGLAKGSGAEPYQVCVDLTGPAYRCSCPSRKSPCKHALGLMLLWSAGQVEAAEPPDWITEWLGSRAERNARAQTRSTRRVGDGKTAQRRAERVAAGVAELDRWLTDQVRQGITSRTGYEHWDAMAARLVDAQAPGLASAVRRLATVAADPERLLTELALIRLLVTGYRRAETLPDDLVATVRSRIGFPVPSEAVLAGPRVRDQWAVVARREEGDERLVVRRCWLHGTSTDRPALVLSFAPPGQPLPADLVPGTAVDAELCFYPGALPLRALVAHRHAPAVPFEEPPGAVAVAAALERYARAVAAEPWLERWPLILAGVVPVRGRGGWLLLDEHGDALPLDPVIGSPWWLVAVAGGEPTTVAAELTAAGLRPLAAWPATAQRGPGSGQDGAARAETGSLLA